jgi:hypothetical protein
MLLSAFIGVHPRFHCFSCAWFAYLAVEKQSRLTVPGCFDSRGRLSYMVLIGFVQQLKR